MFMVTVFFCFYNSSLFLQNGLVVILQLALQSNSTPSLEAARALYLDKIVYVPVELLLCSFLTVNPSALASGRLLNLGGAPGHPSFEMSCSFTVQVLAQLDLLSNVMKTMAVTSPFQDSSTRKWRKLHIPALGAELLAICAQRDLLRNWTRTRAYKNDVQCLRKKIDAKVAKLHFPALGAELSAI